MAVRLSIISYWRSLDFPSLKNYSYCTIYSQGNIATQGLLLQSGQTQITFFEAMQGQPQGMYQIYEAVQRRNLMHPTGESLHCFKKGNLGLATLL